jgi:anti-anti-sigma factor
VVHAATEDVVRVAPTGELDLAGAPALEQALSTAADDAALVILDLRGLTFCETAGLHVVLRADERARRDGRRLVVVPGPPAVHLVFERTGMDDRLLFVDNPRTPTNVAPCTAPHFDGRLRRDDPPSGRRTRESHTPSTPPERE